MSQFKDRGLYPQSLLCFLASCLRMGMSPAEAVRVFSTTFKLSQKQARDLGQMQTLLESGSPVSASIARHEGIPSWLVALLAWCEGNGQLVPALDAAARLLDLESRIGLAVARGLAYPVLLGSALVTLTCLLLMGPWTLVAADLSATFRMLHLKGDAFSREWPGVVWLTDWTLRTCADPLLRVGVLAGGWTAFLVLWFFRDVPGHRQLRSAVEWLMPGVRDSKQTARGALQLELAALALESRVPLPELTRELAPLSLAPGEREALLDIATELERGTPLSLLVQHPCGPLSTALITGGQGGLEPGALRNLASRLEGTALIGLNHKVNLLAPFTTIALALVLSLVPIGQFLSVVRLTALLSESLN